jgi:LysR family transcriptional regulator (chromosome initiation inhibitor)
MGIIQNPILSTFVLVAKNGSVHAAARELGLTQTAVTKRVKALEEDLSVTLFLRSRRGMELTDEGLALLQHCRMVEELEGTLLSRISGKERLNVELTIVGPTSAISTRVVSNCAGLFEKHSQLRLHLRSDDHGDLIEMIRKGEADLAIVPPEDVPNEMESKMLKADRYYLVGSPKWKERRLDDILENERIIDFYEKDQTTRQYLKQFDMTPKAMKGRLYVNENQALITLFSKGVGFGTLTETVARPYLEAGTLILLNKGHVMENPLAMAWYPRPKKTDYFQDVIRAIN